MKLFIISLSAAAVFPAWGEAPDRDIGALVARDVRKMRSPAYLPESVRTLEAAAVPVARVGLERTLAELNAEHR